MQCSSTFCRRVKKLLRTIILIRRGLVKRLFLLSPDDFPLRAGVKHPDGLQACSVLLKPNSLPDKDSKEKVLEMQHNLDPVFSQGTLGACS